MESILITGASGFIGSFIVEEALKRKFGVWAGIRSSSSREYLRNRKIHILELDFAHPNELRAQLSGHKGTYNKFDYIIHCAGVTKCTDKREFDRVNYLQTKYFVDTLRELNMIPKQFIYISTLSVFGPVHEKTYQPITPTPPGPCCSTHRKARCSRLHPCGRRWPASPCRTCRCPPRGCSRR